MKSRLICILSCLMFLNTFSFAGWFFGNSQKRTQTRTRTPRPVCTTVAPFYTQTDVDNRSTYRIINDEWHRFFLEPTYYTSGRDYYEAMKDKLVFRLTFEDAEVPAYILRNFQWICALYDPDEGAYNVCKRVVKTSNLEGKVCIREYYINDNVKSFKFGWF